MVTERAGRIVPPE
jgi:hypothetical protein